MTVISTAPDQVALPSNHHRTRLRMLGVAGAVLAPLALWSIAVPVVGVDLSVRPGGGSTQTVGAGAILAVSLLASLLGWALLAVLERRSARARNLWTGVAVAVLLTSLAGPLTGATTATSKTVLALMHLSLGAVLIPALRHSSTTHR